MKSEWLFEGYPTGQGLCQQKSALRTEHLGKGSLWAGSANRWTGALMGQNQVSEKDKYHVI